MNRRPLITAGILLGIGLGGFIDGIMLHQIFQMHSMLSAKLPQDVLINVKVSMVWDGLFHLFTWIVTAIGLVVLFYSGKKRDCPWSGTTLWGSLFAGWGIFNFTEGLIDHYIFEVHHVVEQMGLSKYDYFFLASGIFFILIGMALIALAKRHTAATHLPPRIIIHKR